MQRSIRAVGTSAAPTPTPQPTSPPERRTPPPEPVSTPSAPSVPPIGMDRPWGGFWAAYMHGNALGSAMPPGGFRASWGSLVDLPVPAMKRPPLNSPFAELAARLAAELVRAAAAGPRPTSMSSPSPNRRTPSPKGAAEAARPAASPREVSFDHLNAPGPAEALERWQAERRQEAAQRGWERAMEASGVLGNPRPDGRSNPSVANRGIGHSLAPA